MKNIFLLLASISCLAIRAQEVRRIDGLKDTYGDSFVYCGEVLNGKPNGMGVAFYDNEYRLRYVGSFANGQINGRGVLFLKNGAFFSGEWKAGKFQGKGTVCAVDGSLTIGNYVNEVRDGRCVLWYKDNGFFTGQFKSDKMNGRGIFVNAAGTVLSDNYYTADKLDGPGFQYEVDAKKMYTGEWKNGAWVKETSPAFTSFLNNGGLTTEKTSGHILVGAVTSSKLLKDSAFYYDLGKKKKYFGFYIDGKLKNGIVLRDDSTFFWGSLAEKGAEGFCYDYKKGRYYTEGNYLYDKLNGKILDIDLTKQSVYIGDAVNGTYTGKAYFFSKMGTMYRGDYLNGRFTGKGIFIDYDGRSVEGSWQDGSPVQSIRIGTKSGSISAMPKTFDEGLAIIVKEFKDNWFSLSGSELDSSFQTPGSDATNYLSYFTFPGSMQQFNWITSGEGEFYHATFASNVNFQQAVSTYNGLVAKIKAAQVLVNKVPVKFKGKAEVPDKNQQSVISPFSMATSDPLYVDFKAYVTILKTEDDQYEVQLIFGSEAN